MLFDTRSKIPALPRSANSVASNTAFIAGTSGSALPGLKSAAAMRMRVLGMLVPVCTQSWAPSSMADRQSGTTKVRASNLEKAFMRGTVLPGSVWEKDQLGKRSAWQRDRLGTGAARK
jgi:hypothetical protein